MQYFGTFKKNALAVFFSACWLFLLTGSHVWVPLPADFAAQIAPASDSPTAQFFSNFEFPATDEIDFEWLEDLEEDDQTDDAEPASPAQQNTFPLAQNLYAAQLSSKPAGIGSIPLYLLFCQLKAHIA